jgi:uroporphyrinogen III methyltransferase/synthase
MPTLAITPPSDWRDLDHSLTCLADFHWLILTSANAVEYFFQRLMTLNQDIRALGNLKIAVVGRKTAATLNKYHLQPDFTPPDFVADSLVANFPEILNNQKILFPRVETGGREILVQELTKQGATVTEVAAYQSQCPKSLDLVVEEALIKGDIEIITFASSKTVQNFALLVEHLPKSILDSVIIASIGPQTSKTCQELWGRVDIEATEYTLEGLTQALINYTAKNS